MAACARRAAWDFLLASILLTGSPIPFGGQDVLIHNVAFAGWQVSLSLH